MLTTINVTQEHINASIKVHRCYECPIARAINVVLNKNKYYADVKITRFNIRSQVTTNVQYENKLPEVAVDFIQLFDRYNPESLKHNELSFQLEIPKEFLA